MWILRQRPWFFCEADDANAGGGAGDSNADEGNSADGTGDAGATDKTFTQADVDRILADRLKREAKKIRAEVETAIKAEADKAAMSEAERLKAEKDEAAKAAAEAQTKANAKIIRAEARVQALAMGIKAERLDYVLRLTDLTGVDVDDNGDPDTTAIKAALATITKDFPELIGSAGASGGSEGFNGKGASGGPATQQQVDEWLANPKEFEKHYAEIQAFYANKAKK